MKTFHASSGAHVKTCLFKSKPTDIILPAKAVFPNLITATPNGSVNPSYGSKDG